MTKVIISDADNTPNGMRINISAHQIREWLDILNLFRTDKVLAWNKSMDMTGKKNKI